MSTSYPNVTGEATPLDETWQQRFARLLAAGRGALNRIDLRHPLVGLAEKAALTAGGQRPLPPPQDVGGLMSPERRSSGGGLGELLIGDAPKSFEQWGRGDAPYTVGEPGLAGRLPMLKPGRAQQAVDIASMMPAEWATGLVGKGAPAVVGAIRRKGDVMPQVSAAVLQKSMVPKDVALDDSPSTNIIKDKIAKWLVKSAGESDPVLERLPALYRPYREGAFPEPFDDMESFRAADEGRLSPATLSRARGLPEAPHGSLQELVDFSLKEAFGHGYGDLPAHGYRKFPVTRADSASMANYGGATDVGMTPENFRKMMEIMPEGSIMARPSQSILGPSELGTQFKDLSEWASDQDPAKLQKMTIPQMFQARHTDLAQAIKEYEKTQRGTVEMRFPEKGLEWQKLEPRHLEREGKEAAHCVGGYCEAVESGQMQVFSLRDEKNKPKVTISITKTAPRGYLDSEFERVSAARVNEELSADEYDRLEKVLDVYGSPYLPDVQWETLERLLINIIGPERTAGLAPKKMPTTPAYQVDQIKGKANSVPTEYVDEIKAFLDAKGWDYKDSGDWRRLESETRRIANGAPGELEGRPRLAEGDIFAHLPADPGGNAFEGGMVPPLRAEVLPAVNEAIQQANQAFPNIRIELPANPVVGEVYVNDIPMTMNPQGEELFGIDMGGDLVPFNDLEFEDVPAAAWDAVRAILRAQFP